MTHWFLQGRLNGNPVAKVQGDLLHNEWERFPALNDAYQAGGRTWRQPCVRCGLGMAV